MLQILTTDLQKDLNEGNDENSAHPYVLAASQIPKIHCRLINVEPVIALKNLKANYYGGLFKINSQKIMHVSFKFLVVICPVPVI